MSEQEIPRPVAVGQVKSIEGDRITIDDPERGEVVVCVNRSPVPEEIRRAVELHQRGLWACGCLINDGGAHRVGCPDHPEGVRGSRLS